MGYSPPFSINEEILSLSNQISEMVGQISITHRDKVTPQLRRVNRIKTIHSSLAIEQNTLSLEQVTAVLNGKKVLAPPQDIKEVQNAYEAYELMFTLNPYNMNDLFKAHYAMTHDLIKEAGRFRSDGAGVIDTNTDEVIHVAPPAEYVTSLMEGLFDWYKQSALPILIKSCIFHYEFEFIHPFSDGNGRTGRLWHSLLLSQWNPLFAWLPIETLIKEEQEAYYQAINSSNQQGDDALFVSFMLKVILAALQEVNETTN